GPLRSWRTSPGLAYESPRAGGTFRHLAVCRTLRAFISISCRADRGFMLHLRRNFTPVRGTWSNGRQFAGLASTADHRRRVPHVRPACSSRGRSTLIVNPRFDAIFAFSLGAVKSGVGIVEECRSVLVVASQSGRDPDAHSYGKEGPESGRNIAALISVRSLSAVCNATAMLASGNIS